MRAAIVGMTNPHRPGDPLSPTADRNAGYRLWKMSGMSLEAYQGAFERMNLLEERQWSPWRARAAGRRMRRRLAGRSVVVLGRGVWRALALPGASWFETVGVGTSAFTLLPHPSGRCLLYNEAANREEAGRCLRRISTSSRT